MSYGLFVPWKVARISLADGVSMVMKTRTGWRGPVFVSLTLGGIGLATALEWTMVLVAAAVLLTPLMAYWLAEHVSARGAVAVGVILAVGGVFLRPSMLVAPIDQAPYALLGLLAVVVLTGGAVLDRAGWSPSPATCATERSARMPIPKRSPSPERTG
jgi:hypothetical protein